MSYIFMICWAPEAPGPVPNCRSHFCGSNRGIESSWNLQNTSFMTKQCSKTFHEVFLKYFLFFLLFLEPWRLWDHSQIVDLIFLIWMVSTRASETSKTPHSWQNNVPKRPKTFLEVCFQSIFFVHCFVMDEVFLGFCELSSIPSGSEKWDLQF